MAVITVAALVACGAPAARADWQLPELMISVWGGPHDEATAAAFADAGFNTVMCNQDQLDACRRHGLKALVMDATPEQAKTLGNAPAVWGFFVRDEPKPEEFAQVAEPVAAFHAAAPNRPAYVNLMAYMPLDQYLNTVHPRFLSYDYYQWWWGTQNHFGRLAAHREAALGAGIPLICWVEANADPRWEWGKPGATYLPDNAAKLRQSVYTALAYGVKGIQWFVGPLVFETGEGGVLLPKLTQAGEDIKAINAELAALGPELLPLRSVGVTLGPGLGDQGSVPPAEPWVTSKTSRLVIGQFGGPGGEEAALVVNGDVQHARRAVLHLQGEPEGFQRFDAAKRKWERLPAEQVAGDVIARMTLEAGEGVLIRRQ